MQDTHRLSILAAFAALFWGAYEYSKWSSCRAGIEFVYNKDVLIAAEPPCNVHHSLYSHRLDCDAVRKDTDASMFYSNVAQCFFEKHILFGWWGFALLVCCTGVLLRHYLKERREARRMKAWKQLRRLGVWPVDPTMPALPQPETVHQNRIPRGHKN